MRITDIRCIQYEAKQDIDEKYYEERLVRPVDMYDEFRVAGWPKVLENLPEEGEGVLVIKGIFLLMDTDEGLQGIFGPIARTSAFHALNMRELLLGQDALATRKVWDLLYRNAVHGRKGSPMMGISAIDCALWDLKGKAFHQPVYRILGGPTRDALPVYASMLGYSLDPELVRQRVKEFLPYSGQKWFFRHGPSSGNEGLLKNIELVKVAREAAGEDYDLMFDAWMSWDVPYTLKMADHISEYHPRWIEEPLLPDKITPLAEITTQSAVTITGAEHEYTRWGFQEILRHHALDIIQPDTMWAGGISEMMNICALASVYDIPVIPHGESVAANIHLITAWPSNVCPLVEFLVKFNQAWQFFLQDPVTPCDGFIEPDERPGLGLVIDETKIEDRREITFGG
jgi:L-alanine-DL-glutamate epimerase-like enolase superfamily enzyme